MLAVGLARPPGGGRDAPQMTVHGFWTAQDAMADAGETASLAAGPAGTAPVCCLLG